MTAKQYQAVCSNCDSVLILEDSEIEKGEFTCSECNHINKFDRKDLVELEDTEDLTDTPEKPVSKNKKIFYIAGIVIVALVAIYFLDNTYDFIPFLNKKGKAEKHMTKGTELLNSQMNSQTPDVQVLQNALAEFKKVLEYEPDNAQALYNKAIILTSSGNFTESITDLDRVITLNPSNPDAYFYRAFCKLQLGDLANSLSDFDKNLELYPDNLSAVFYRANTRYLLKDFTGAKTDMDKIIQNNPELPNGYALRGLCEVELGNKKPGCDDFQKAKELGFPEADSLINRYCK